MNKKYYKAAQLSHGPAANAAKRVKPEGVIELTLEIDPRIDAYDLTEDDWARVMRMHPLQRVLITPIHLLEQVVEDWGFGGGAPPQYKPSGLFLAGELQEFIKSIE